MDESYFAELKLYKEELPRELLCPLLLIYTKLIKHLNGIVLTLIYV